MRSTPRKTVSRQEAADRTIAKVVGVIYLAGMAIGIGGNLLIQSVLTGPEPLAAIAANGTLLAIAAVMWLVTVVGDVAHGVLMYPILKRHSERMAVGYLAARIVDATFIAIMTLLIVMQIPLGRQYLLADPAGVAALGSLSAVLTDANLYAYSFAMASLGISGLILCTALLRAKLIPRGLAIWGLVGYAVIMVGELLEILGFHLNSIQAMPGALWEVFIGGWLIVKGFNRFTGGDIRPSATPALATATLSTTPVTVVPIRADEKINAF